GEDVGIRVVVGRSAHPHVHAGGDAGQQQAVSHVAGRVADEGEGLAGQGAAVLTDGEQVGQRLAGVELSVRALTTGTPAYAAISSSRDCSWVRQTMAEACRPSTRAVSAIDSRTP